MGVSISWAPAPVLKETDITPGVRSQAAELLREHGWIGLIDATTMPDMIATAAREQSNEMRKMIMALFDALEQHGTIVVELHY